MKKRITLTLLFVCIPLCITFAQASPVLIDGLEIPPGQDVPDKGGNAFIILKQYDNNCGPTSVQMVLHYYGKIVKLAEVWEAGDIESVIFGTTPDQLKKALNNLGVGAKGYEDRDMLMPWKPFASLKSCIDDDRPPIIFTEIASGVYHWVVVVGYEAESPESLERYLIADPNGRFEWYDKLSLNKKWSLCVHEKMEQKDIIRRGGFQLNTLIHTVVHISTGPYTMIVPDTPSDPTLHLPGYWSDMHGGQYEGERGLNLFGDIKTEITFETKEFPPFDDYHVSWRKLLTSASVAELQENKTVRMGNVISFTGRFTTGLFLPGKIWVVVRTYSKLSHEIVEFPDDELRALIETALGKKTGDPITVADLQNLTRLDGANKGIKDLTGLRHATKLSSLDLNGNAISDITPLAGLTDLTSLQLSKTSISDLTPLAGLINLSGLFLQSNAISDITPLAGLTNLDLLLLNDNHISDLTPLVKNTGIDRVDLNGNLLHYEAFNTHIPALEARGVTVFFDDRTPKTLTNISGDNNQPVAIGKKLADPFIVEVQDQRGKPFEGVPVTFTLTAGNGTLSNTNTVTDKNGKAETTLTIGTTFLAQTITVSAADITDPVTFTYDAIMDIDVNGDGFLKIDDLALVITNFGATMPSDAAPNPDVNGDGTVDEKDFLLVSDSLLAQTADGVGAPPVAYADALPELTAETVQKWIRAVKQRSKGDPRFDSGIALLEQLLASIRPAETAVLPNYPNPFNPETWLPYQLSEPAAVTVTIYDIQGRVVRALDLGHQRVGIYHSRSRAAHWDGRNAVGEPVASGLYFYTLEADTFTATRKMLIRK